MKYSMLKGRAISNRGSHVEVFEQESFTFVCLRTIKHGDPVGDQRIGFVLLYLCLSLTSNVLFPLRFLRFNTASPLNLCQSRQNLVANLRLLLFF